MEKGGLRNFLKQEEAEADEEEKYSNEDLDATLQE